jgi:hypothetical protein
VTIEGERASGSAYLGGVDLLATLGRTESTAVHLQSFEWLDGTAPVTADTGSFTLTGLCREGGTRLIDPEGSVAIRSVVPNPGRDKVVITYDLNEPGRHSMRVYDATGREVRRLFDGTMIPGTYRRAADLRTMASGLYWIELRTPTVRIVRRLAVRH